MVRKNEVGEWLDTFEYTCSICGRNQKYEPAGGEPPTSGIHCSACWLALGAIQGMVTVKDADTMDAGRGYYVRTMFEAVFARLHKLQARVAELEAKR